MSISLVDFQECIEFMAELIADGFGDLSVVPFEKKQLEHLTRTGPDNFRQKFDRFTKSYELWKKYAHCKSYKNDARNHYNQVWCSFFEVAITLEENGLYLPRRLEVYGKDYFM